MSEWSTLIELLFTRERIIQSWRDGRMTEDAATHLLGMSGIEARRYAENMRLPIFDPAAPTNQRGNTIAALLPEQVDT